MDNENSQLRHHRRGKEPASGDGMLKLRNYLNIIFMVGAVIGVLLYFFHDQTIGTIIILVAMVFKIVESALRFLH